MQLTLRELKHLVKTVILESEKLSQTETKELNTAISELSDTELVELYDIYDKEEYHRLQKPMTRRSFLRGVAGGLAAITAILAGMQLYSQNGEVGDEQRSALLNMLKLEKAKRSHGAGIAQMTQAEIEQTLNVFDSIIENLDLMLKIIAPAIAVAFSKINAKSKSAKSPLAAKQARYITDVEFSKIVDHSIHSKMEALLVKRLPKNPLADYLISHSHQMINWGLKETPREYIFTLSYTDFRWHRKLAFTFSEFNAPGEDYSFLDMTEEEHDEFHEGLEDLVNQTDLYDRSGSYSGNRYYVHDTSKESILEVAKVVYTRLMFQANYWIDDGISSDVAAELDKKGLAIER